MTDIKAQQQVLPGKDTDMDPLAEFTKLECWDDNGKPYLKEVSFLFCIQFKPTLPSPVQCSIADAEYQYVGSGKLKGKKAIVTGGKSF